MTAPLTRQYADGSKADTPNGVNVANFLLGTGNLWDLIQTLGVGVKSVAAGTTGLTQADAGLVLIDATAGNVILNLPAANAAIGALFQFKRIDSSANTVTINRAGADTIDGATSFTVGGQYEIDEIRSDGSAAWRRLDTLANPIRARQQLGVDVAQGQCQLQYVSTISIKLVPFDGNKLTVNGVPCTVPDAGVSLASTGLLATTLYYIYATQSGGAINALEASTTAPATDTGANNKGVRIKTGDAARTLVGMVYTKVAATFADSGTQRFVRSWFNETGIAGAATLSANQVVGFGPWGQLSTTSNAEVALWAGEMVDVDATASVVDTGTFGTLMYLGIGIDTTSAASGRTGAVNVTVQNYNFTMSAATVYQATEGYHAFNTVGGQSGGSGPTYAGGYCGVSYTTTRR